MTFNSLSAFQRIWNFHNLNAQLLGADLLWYKIGKVDFPQQPKSIRFVDLRDIILS
jgi:hypothetical protein